MHTNNSSPSFRRIVDVSEQLILVVLYGWFCIRIFPEEVRSQNLYSLLILLSEGTVLVFIIFRRKTDNISTSLRDWFVAFAGTTTVLLVGKGGEPFLPTIGTLIVLTGFIIHFGAKLSLRRSFGIVPADRGIKCDGLYRYIRHPMYFGYFVTHLGYLLAVPSLWNFVIYCLTWTFLVARIIFEERLLSENPDYLDYLQRVRYRLIPKLF